MKVDSLINVKIKMKKGNPSKWVKRSEEHVNNEHLVWLVSEENASTLHISSILELQNIAKAMDNEIDIIKVVEDYDIRNK